MKANGFIAALALAIAVIVAAPVAALAAQGVSFVSHGVASFLAEEHISAEATASDVSFRLQEALLEKAPTEDKSVTEAAAPEAPKAVEAEPVAEAPKAEKTSKTEAGDAALSDTADGDDTAEAEKVLAPRSLKIGGQHIPYIDYFKKDTAPERGAGLWMGSDSTTDGDWGYFIGHNPGDFAPVMDLVEGDIVSVCDTDAAARDYTVVDIFDVKVGTYWHEIEERVSGYGESIILQACCGDNAHYRVVVAV